MKETTGQSHARYATELANESLGKLKRKLTRNIESALDCSHFERAESFAKVLAILLVSERN